MTKPNQLDALGNKSDIPNHPDKNVLEKVNNPKIGVNYSIRLTCPEFTGAVAVKLLGVPGTLSRGAEESSFNTLGNERGDIV